MKTYTNKAWEPAFPEISPVLSFVYFHSRNYYVRAAVATLIFKKLTWMEWRQQKWI